MLHLRFFVHILPLLAVCVAAGLDLLLSRITPTAGAPKHAIAIALAIALAWGLESFEKDWRAFASIDQFGAGYVVNNSTNIQRANIPLGIWLHQHARADMRLATWDIGAIGYYSQLPVIDLFGLTSRRIAQLRRLPDGPTAEEVYVEGLEPELIATYSEADSLSVDWPDKPWLMSHYSYHSKWRDEGPGTGPSLLVRKDIHLPSRSP